MRCSLLLFWVFLVACSISNIPTSKLFPELAGIQKGSDVSELLATMGEAKLQRNPMTPESKGGRGTAPIGRYRRIAPSLWPRGRFCRFQTGVP